MDDPWFLESHEIRLQLRRAGADPSAVDFKNRCALHFARTAEAVEVPRMRQRFVKSRKDMRHAQSSI